MSETTHKLLDLRAVFGLTAKIVKPAADTGESEVVMEVTADPGSATTIHRHIDQEEVYEIVQGTLEVFYDGTWHCLNAGDTCTVPSGAIHGFRNSASTPVRFINLHRPAHGFQRHLETLDHLIREGKIRSVKDPKSLLYMSLSASTYKPDVSVKPPQLIVNFFGSVARFLRLRLPDV